MKGKILVIEDNEQNLYLTTFLLTQSGFEVMAARSGTEGIDLASRIRPNLILLDIQLPQMDGYAVARELRRHPALKDVPIVAVTSYAMVGDRERVLAAGCDGYIEKPINPDTFLGQIETFLEKRPREIGLRPMNILIVDDHEPSRYQLEVLLQASGYEVRCATQGVEALALARDHPPDVIGSDILMPVMDGFTLCRECKKDERLRHIPFIFYTATYTDEKDRELALRLGAARFIVKPQEIEPFVQMIRQVIQEASGASPLTPGPTSAAPDLDETTYLQQYNEALIRKLEDKMQQLEISNRQLRKEIAERERAEAARREMENIVNRSPVVVFLRRAEPGWPVAYVSENVRQFGYSPEDFTSGRIHYADIVHPEDRPRVAEEVARYSEERGRTEFTQQYRILTATATERWIEDRTGIRRDAGGRVTHYQGILLDVTERRRAEEERERLRAQLMQAQKLEAIGTLAAGVAHEINNPMMVVMNFADLIAAQAKGDERLVEFADRIKREAERMARLTKNLLMFARPEDGPFGAARLSDVVENTLALIRGVLLRDQIHVEVDVPENLPQVRCRRQQLQQVVMNLLTNARDALNAKYVRGAENKRIRIFAQEFAGSGEGGTAGGRRIRLTVEDYGIGIPENIRPRIFDPFFTTKPLEQGTGLGLSISYGIVRDHGGTLTVESVPGQWTRFHVDLPVAP